MCQPHSVMFYESVMIRVRVFSGFDWIRPESPRYWAVFTTMCNLTFCSFHLIEQNICLVGTSINKDCTVYYFSVTHGLRISR